LLALLGAYPILHVSRIRVNPSGRTTASNRNQYQPSCADCTEILEASTSRSPKSLSRPAFHPFSSVSSVLLDTISLHDRHKCQYRKISIKCWSHNGPCIRSLLDTQKIGNTASDVQLVQFDRCRKETHKTAQIFNVAPT